MTAPSELLIRRVAALAAAVGAALLVGLAPPVRFQIDTTSEPARSTVLSPVYGGHGVQQSLGEPASPILRAKIWAGAGLAGPATLVTASLVTGDVSEPVRQFSFQARPSAEPLPQTLVFQPYDLPTGSEVRLQLAVSPDAQNFVSFATASFAPSINRDFKQPELDGQPLDFLGPLAYELEGEGSGFRAAWFHGGSERTRLAGAVAALLAGLVLRFLGSGIVRLALAVPSIRPQPAEPDAPRRIFFYPWLIPVFGVLSFYSSNILVFELSEMVRPIAISLAAVTIFLAALWIWLRDAGLAAAIVAIVAAVFVSYGHVHDLIDASGDHRVWLPVAVVSIGVFAYAAWFRRRWARGVGRFLNYATVPLVAIPLVSIGLLFRPSVELDDPSIPDRAAAAISGVVERPDIYYIILDSYDRADMLEPFDNSAFLTSLEDRGFYVADRARSNYRKTEFSIPSSLSMRYLDEFDRFGDAEKLQARELARDHLLGRVLERLGYRTVHLDSGFSATSSNTAADLLVDFTPSGPVVIRDRAGPTGTSGDSRVAPNRFLWEFARTTLLKPFVDVLRRQSQRAPYSWSDPGRALAAFAYLRTIPALDGPTFTFAHIIKPHHPFNFDRNGNISPYPGFSDDHDPTVPGAYHGQLLYVNELVLETVDFLLRESSQPPVIVISSDHGTGMGLGDDARNAILAAYHLPNGGNEVLYPSITSVNSFRVILDYYFDLGMGRLEDKVFDF